MIQILVLFAVGQQAASFGGRRRFSRRLEARRLTPEDAAARLRAQDHAVCPCLHGGQVQARLVQ